MLACDILPRLLPCSSALSSSSLLPRCVLEIVPNSSSPGRTPVKSPMKSGEIVSFPSLTISFELSRPAVFLHPTLFPFAKPASVNARFLLISISIILGAYYPTGVGLPRKALAKLRRNGYATGYKPREREREADTPRDFNDLSSGIRRLAIDTRFQLSRRYRRRLEIHRVLSLSLSSSSSSSSSTENFLPLASASDTSCREIAVPPVDVSYRLCDHV